MGKKNKIKLDKYPFVSICTPTFNRRPFIPYIMKCFDNQDYPKDKMEWIIIDDGTDPIEDIISSHPKVKYFKLNKKMSLGEKRNLSHAKSSGEIIVYMDDDDYYPSNRVSHAVESLQKNPKILCAGSSELFVYFDHIKQLYKFGPYGPNHATAASFAFRRKLLNQTSYDTNAAVSEEKHFLKNYTIPMVQLDPLKTILVFSHIQNSFDKKKLLETPNPYVKLSDKNINDLVKEDDLKQFFVIDLNNILLTYDAGDIKNKPDIVKQLDKVTNERKNEQDFRIFKQLLINNMLEHEKNKQ